MRHHSKRSNLFLLRVWEEETDQTARAAEAVRWCGKVQRVVDGESHQFDDWQSLIDLLLAMLSRDERRLRR